MSNREERIENNLGLVHACAHRFTGRGIEYEELYSAGCVGLVKAAGRFDEERGVCFSTYAVPVILGEIKLLFRDGGAIKVSRSLKELSMKIGRVNEQFTAKYGRQPQISELSEILGVSAEQISEAVMASRPLVSLTCDDDERDSENDIPVPSPDESINDRLSVRQIIARLNDDDKRLIVLRYYKNKTQSQTAQMLGMSQVQVSRREKKILLDMRAELI